jgi:hypothetical protein
MPAQQDQKRAQVVGRIGAVVEPISVGTQPGVTALTRRRVLVPSWVSNETF